MGGYRDRLIKIFSFVGGLYFFLEFILPKTIFGFEFGANNEEITNGFLVLSTMAFGLGLINLLFIHGSKIVFARKGWVNSAALLIGLISMILLTSLEWIHDDSISKQSNEYRNLADYARIIKSDSESKAEGKKPYSERVSLLIEAINRQKPKIEEIQSAAVAKSLVGDLIDGWNGARSELFRNSAALAAGLGQDLEAENVKLEETAVALGQLAATQGELLGELKRRSFSSKAYSLVFDGLFVSLGSAMFSLLGFYIVSAAFRAFRIRNMEAALMMVAAVLVMLGQIPFYAMISDHLPMVRGWLLAVPNSGAFKAIQFGAAIAGLVMAIRIWLSIESSSFMSEETRS